MTLKKKCSEKLETIASHLNNLIAIQNACVSVEKGDNTISISVYGPRPRVSAKVPYEYAKEFLKELERDAIYKLAHLGLVLEDDDE